MKNEKEKKPKNNKNYSQFSKSSGLIPLTSNPGTGTYDCWMFGSPISSQGWYSGVCGDGSAPLGEGVD
jgi:hypothetical protein